MVLDLLLVFAGWVSVLVVMDLMTCRVEVAGIDGSYDSAVIGNAGWAGFWYRTGAGAFLRGASAMAGQILSLSIFTVAVGMGSL